MEPEQSDIVLWNDNIMIPAAYFVVIELMIFVFSLGMKYKYS